MALPTAYLTTTKNLEGILGAIQNAQAPEKFTVRFLQSLEYASAADRLVIGVLKALKLLDENSAPTERYFTFLDQGESQRVLAEAIREAYEDLFRVNIKANELSVAEVKNKLKTLTQGQKSEPVLDDMAQTFVALCQLADWTILPKPEKPQENEDTNPPEGNQITPPIERPPLPIGQLCYNIQIILPATRDTAVYDALFKESEGTSSKMNTIDQIYAFAFRGVLAEDALDAAGRRRSLGSNQLMEEEIVARLSLDLIDQELVARASRMAIVYTAIASFENTVRKLIMTVLLEQIGADWWQKSVPNKVREKAESRQKDEAQIRWHTPRGDEFINYTEFGDLLSLE